MESSSKKIKVKVYLLIETNILLMAKKGIRWEMSPSIHQYAKANDKCMKDYDKSEESSFIQYWDGNNLYG